MKRLLFAIIVAVTIFSCNNGSEDPKGPEDPNYVPTHEDTLHYLDSLARLHDSTHH